MSTESSQTDRLVEHHEEEAVQRLGEEQLQTIVGFHGVLSREGRWRKQRSSFARFSTPLNGRRPTRILPQRRSTCARPPCFRRRTLGPAASRSRQHAQQPRHRVRTRGETGRCRGVLSTSVRHRARATLAADDPLGADERTESQGILRCHGQAFRAGPSSPPAPVAASPVRSAPPPVRSAPPPRPLLRRHSQRRPFHSERPSSPRHPRRSISGREPVCRWPR